MEKLLRKVKPFLCLVMMTIPKALSRSDFKPKAEPGLNLGWERKKKAWAVLTLPNRKLVYSVDCRHIADVFPLLVTNVLQSKLYRFLQPDGSDYDRISGPAAILRRRHTQVPDESQKTLIESTPVQMRQPVLAGEQPAPGVSSTRGYTPSAQALQAIVDVAALEGERAYTPDELTAMTPRNTKQALAGANRKIWIESVRKDFRMLRAKGCFVNFTHTKPPGRTPPPAEQRFRFKYKGRAKSQLGCPSCRRK